MLLCHGQQDEHCCWVDGAPCVNLLDGPDAVLAAVQAEVDRWNMKGQANNLAKHLGDGITFGCGVAIKVLAEYVATMKSTSRTWPIDRATFEAEWTSHPDYQQVADAWEGIGKGRDWCVTYGPSEAQCCFAEDQATNDAKAANVPVEIRNLRGAVKRG